MVRLNKQKVTQRREPWRNLRLLFFRKREKNFLYYEEVRVMEYLLAKSYMGGAKMEGHLCVECRKVILDIEQF